MSRFMVTMTMRTYVEAKDQAEAEEMVRDIESEVCLETIRHPRIAVESVKSFTIIQG